MRRSAEDSEAFNETHQQPIQSFRHQLLFMLGDFNAKIGQEREGETFMGLYSRSYRNANGIRLRDFCADNDLFLSDKDFYKKRARNVKSWQGFRGRDQAFDQIDYSTLYSRYALDRCSPVHYLGAGRLLIVIIGSRPHIFSFPIFIRYL